LLAVAAGSLPGEDNLGKALPGLLGADCTHTSSVFAEIGGASP